MLLNLPSFPVGLPGRLIFYISSTSCRLLARSPSSTCSGFGAAPYGVPSPLRPCRGKTGAQQPSIHSSSTYVTPGSQSCLLPFRVSQFWDTQDLRFSLRWLCTVNRIFWRIRPCNLLIANRNFGGTYRLHIETRESTEQEVSRFCYLLHGK
jgi:hypothetical protein